MDTRYLIDVDGRQIVIVQKDTADPLKPGDTAMMIGDYKPRLVKAPQDIIDSLQENKEPSRVRVNEKTGEYLFDDELAPFQSQTESETEHSSEQHHGSETWIEPQANDLIDRTRQQ